MSTRGKYQKKPTRKNRRVQKKKLNINLPNWAKQVLAYALAIAILITVPVWAQTRRLNKAHDAEIEQLVAQYESQITSLREEHDAEIFALNQAYEYGGDVNSIESEAEFISKVIYGTARNHSANDQRAVIWCVLNRVESIGYPDTVAEVCAQPKQWMGYSDENPVIESIYNMVLEELKEWHKEGHRPMGKEFVFLSWSSKEILLRDTFEETKSTRYWRMY